MKPTSTIIQEIRARVGGENIPDIYCAHMSAVETERQRDHARAVVRELFELLRNSAEGPRLDDTRHDELEGLLLLWGKTEEDK